MRFVCSSWIDSVSFAMREAVLIEPAGKVVYKWYKLLVDSTWSLIKHGVPFKISKSYAYTYAYI